MTQSLVLADALVPPPPPRLIPGGQPGIQAAATMMLARSVLLGRLVGALGYAAAMIAVHGATVPTLRRYVLPFVIVAALTQSEIMLLPRTVSGSARIMLVLADTVVGLVIYLLWTADPIQVIFQVGSAGLTGVLLGLHGAPLWLGQAIQAAATCWVVLTDKVAPAATTVLLVTGPALIVAAGAVAVTGTQLLQARLARDVDPARPAAQILERARNTLRRSGLAWLRLPPRRGRPDLADELADTLARDTATAMEQAAVPVNGIRFDQAEPDFTDALDLLCRDWAGHTRLAVRTDLHPVWLRAPSRHQLALIVEDALNNISEHARATRVQIEIVERRTLFTLSVRDNGQGFTAPGGLRALGDGQHEGLRRMVARSTYLGADLTIITAPYSGTEVQVRMQLGAFA